MDWSSVRVAVAVLVLSSCGSATSKAATSSVAASHESTTTQYVEGSFAPAGGTIVRLNERPLEGATELGSFAALSKAAEAAAIAGGIHVSIVDPTPVVGASAKFYFNGLAGAAVGNNITVEMDLGAWSDIYAENLVAKINSLNPGVVAIRLKDAPLDYRQIGRATQRRDHRIPLVTEAEGAGDEHHERARPRRRDRRHRATVLDDGAGGAVILDVVPAAGRQERPHGE